jgi:hypothetical protein
MKMISRSHLFVAIGITTAIVLTAFASLPRTLATIRMRTQRGVVELRAEIARSPKEQREGLAGRRTLPDDRGMLFLWNEKVIPTFTMEGMRFPLDIIFIDENGTIVDIAENLPPCPNREGCAMVTPITPVRFALEVRAGFAEERGIARGDKATVILP